MNPRVEVITVGDELLVGQTVNTNAAFLSERLSKAGYEVFRSTAVADTREAIHAILKEAWDRSDVVLMTGGLGPTKDDITKFALAEYFGSEMMESEEVLKMVRAYFEKRGKPLLPANIEQAKVPTACSVILNEHGSAPGMWFERKGKVLVSMPGVPYEMQALMDNTVLQRIRDHFPPRAYYRRTLLTAGIGESFLAEQLRDWEEEVRKKGVALAYLPSPGIVKVRLDKVGCDDAMKVLIDEKAAVFRQRVGEHFFGEEGDTLEAVVGNMLKCRKETLAIAESCTGGNIAHRITSTAGSSGYFRGGVVAYANEVKQQLLGVTTEDLEQHGAVSEPVVRQMARGAREALGVDWVVATSGIMGPSGGSREKPVGIVWIAVAGPEGVTAKRFLFGDQRDINIVRATQAGLDMLRRSILDASEKEHQEE